LSSRLALLAHPDVLARTAVDRAKLLSLPPRGAGSLRTNAQQEVLTYIYGGTDPAAVAALTRAGAKVVHVSERYHVVTAFVAPRRLNAISAVRTVREVCRFYGTSAAAPHAAAVAALMKEQADEQDVSLDQALVEEILEETAAPMQGPERRVGAGLIDAFAAVGGIE
jgi:hypothetical protein